MLEKCKFPQGFYLFFIPGSSVERQCNTTKNLSLTDSRARMKAIKSYTGLTCCVITHGSVGCHFQGVLPQSLISLVLCVLIHFTPHLCATCSVCVCDTLANRSGGYSAINRVAAKS